jgi:diguanylate cyclase (GGDEF)-like protein
MRREDAMPNQHYSYLQEKRHALFHLVVVFLMSIGVVMGINTMVEVISREYFFLKMLFIGFFIFALFHYLMILLFPNLLIHFRKTIIILVDLTILTLSITILEDNGIFLFPFYLLIVMESGVSFGFVYFYFSALVATLSWATLLYYSAYWSNSQKVVATFVILTFLIPLIYLRQMRQMYKKQEKLHKSLLSTNRDANYDTLTGLANRKRYDRYMKEVIKEKSFFALLFIDLNKFKSINDTHGHDIGDEVLIEVARRLERSIDEGDMLARLGGDEFVILTKRKKAFLAKFMENLEQNTIGRHQIGRISVLIELSIGISLYPDDSKSETFLRKYADEAMYEAKRREGEYHIFYSDIAKISSK